eukprot:5121261-Amphidinium_carterae.3
MQTTQQHHQRGGLRNQKITEIDYAFFKSANDRYKATVLTMCESTTGLGHSTMVPYPADTEYTDHTRHFNFYDNRCHHHILQLPTTHRCHFQHLITGLLGNVPPAHRPGSNTGSTTSTLLLVI